MRIRITKTRLKKCLKGLHEFVAVNYLGGSSGEKTNWVCLHCKTPMENRDHLKRK